MIKLIWHGTASVELRCDAGRILFDPFIPLKGSQVDVKPEDFDGFTDVLITHGHFDHIASLPQIYRRNPEMRIYCTASPYITLLKKGIPEKNLVKIGFGQELELNGFRLSTFHGKHAVLPKATPSQLKRILSDRNAGNVPATLREVIQCKENDETVLYQIETEGTDITLMGSMNLRDGVDYPIGSDLLILPYNGWEDNFPPAVRVIGALRPEKIFLDHWDDTFPPVTSPLDLEPVLTRFGDRIFTPGYGEITIQKGET